MFAGSPYRAYGRRRDPQWGAMQRDAVPGPRGSLWPCLTVASWTDIGPNHRRRTDGNDRIDPVVGDGSEHRCFCALRGTDIGNSLASFIDELVRRRRKSLQGNFAYLALAAEPAHGKRNRAACREQIGSYLIDPTARTCQDNHTQSIAKLRSQERAATIPIERARA